MAGLETGLSPEAAAPAMAVHSCVVGSLSSATWCLDQEQTVCWRSSWLWSEAAAKALPGSTRISCPAACWCKTLETGGSLTWWHSGVAIGLLLIMPGIGV